MTFLRVLFGPAVALAVAAGGIVPAAFAQTTAPVVPSPTSGEKPREAIPNPADSLTTPRQTPATFTDEEFVRKAAAGNRYEIEASRLALTKGGTGKVKDFAAMLVTKHGEVLKELEKAASEAGVAMPSEFKPDGDQRARLDALKAKSGTEFDKLFLADMTKAHDDSLGALKLYLQIGKNPKLQAWASRTIPAVQKHRDTLKEL